MGVGYLIHILAYNMVLLCFFLIIFSTCCSLRLAEGEGVWNREVGESDRQGEVQKNCLV